jgi:hypothetical protein
MEQIFFFNVSNKSVGNVVRTGWQRVRSRTDRRLGSVLSQSPLSPLPPPNYVFSLLFSYKLSSASFRVCWSTVSFGRVPFPAQQVEVDSDAIYCANDRSARILPSKPHQQDEKRRNRLLFPVISSVSIKDGG